uniref:DUF834 domain-containing protein n=1 Tax=Oryza rufipogon TaxID=4529 RepID=A0A0E0Q1E5_ORYRU
MGAVVAADGGRRRRRRIARRAAPPLASVTGGGEAWWRRAQAARGPSLPTRLPLQIQQRAGEAWGRRAQAAATTGPAWLLLSPPLPGSDGSARAADPASVKVADGGSVAGNHGGDGGAPRLGWRCRRRRRLD